LVSVKRTSAENKLETGLALTKRGSNPASPLGESKESPSPGWSAHLTAKVMSAKKRKGEVSGPFEKDRLNGDDRGRKKFVDKSKGLGWALLGDKKRKRVSEKCTLLGGYSSVSSSESTRE